jgi:hypothetical protein
MTRVILVSLCLGLLLVGCGSDDMGTAGDPGSTGTREAGAESEPEASEEAERPDIQVSESGFSDLEGTVAYGAVLENRARDSEARDVEVVVNALDARGDVLTTDTKSLSVIPPSEEFVIGGDLDPGKGDVEDLDIEVETADFGPAEHPLPKVSNVRIEEESYGGVSIRAQVENTLDRELSSIADVFGVVRNSRGKIIAGTFTFPENDINPESKSAVKLTFLSGLPGAATAEVTVDNELAP